ncbi:MAG TPA: Hsp20/alpha crystallin family protein [Anaerolineales bacterium]|nr:Hsp20/alpha crystallin family protein [Anaerolineales bacterium]
MLTRWDPFQEMLNLRRTVDRLFDNAAPDHDWPQPAMWGLSVDLVENKDDFIVKASVPGIHPDDLDISYSDDTLTIKGEIKEDKETKEDQFHLRERRYGSFMRSIALPTKIKGDEIQASYQNGVVTLRLPKAEEVKPKRIAIKVNDQKMIEGKAKNR